MTTEALRSDRSLAATAAAPAARRSRSPSRFFSLLLAGAVPVDGGWAPPPRSAPAAGGCFRRAHEEASR